jgi:hypothetical protein
MNPIVEDSYEGAVARLRRLEQAGFACFDREQEDATQARMRDLEELATVACDENERLEKELAAARDQIGSLQRVVKMLEESLAEEEQQRPPAHVERELAAARDQIGSLQRLVATLEESQPPPPLEIKKRTPIFPMVIAALIGGAATAALLSLRPNVPAVAAAAPPVAPAPVVAKVEPPVVAKVEPLVVVPRVAPVVAKVAPAPVVVPKVKSVHATRRATKHSRHAEHHKKIAAKKDWTNTNDPLSGLNL